MEGKKELKCDFIIIHATLKDGTVISGVYANKSHASERSADGDLYVEKLIKFTDDGLYTIDKNNLGILLKQEDIMSLRFEKGFKCPENTLTHPKTANKMEATQNAKRTAEEQPRPTATVIAGHAPPRHTR